MHYDVDADIEESKESNHFKDTLALLLTDLKFVGSPVYLQMDEKNNQECKNKDIDTSL